MSLEKLLADYEYQEYGRKIIGNEDGFIKYAIHEGECFISDLYVRPEARTTLTSKKLFTEVVNIARETGCGCVTANVWTPKDGGDSGGKKAQKLLRCYLALGFKPVGALNNNVMLRIDLNEED